MWDLALMTIFINHIFYVGYSISQYEIEVLQTSFLKLTSSLEARHAMFQYHMVSCYNIFALSSQND
jgi:hypothetical protein